MRKKTFLFAFLLPAILLNPGNMFRDRAAQAAETNTNLSVEGAVVKINGQTARLVGYGDIGMLADSSFDYAAFFRTLRGNKINMVRVWVNYHWANSLTPYAGNRRDKYNIEQPGDAFYARLAGFVGEADRNGIVVQVCLFDANALETGADDKYKQRWVNAPLNRGNNRNGFLASRNKYFSTDGQCGSDKDKCVWSKVHAPLIDKVTEKLGNYGNVIYEVMNEGDSSRTGASSASVKAFHEAVIARLSDRLRAYSGSRVISINADSSTLKRLALSNSAVSLYSVHLSDNKGPSSSDLRAAKPVIISNDGHCTQAIVSYINGHADQRKVCRNAVSSSESDDERARRTGELLQKVFPNRTERNGRVHFDFLDKGINGSSWPRGQDYNPRAGNFDRKVLDKLNNYAF